MTEIHSESTTSQTPVEEKLDDSFDSSLNTSYEFPSDFDCEFDSEADYHGLEPYWSPEPRGDGDFVVKKMEKPPRPEKPKERKVEKLERMTASCEEKTAKDSRGWNPMNSQLDWKRIMGGDSDVGYNIY